MGIVCGSVIHHAKDHILPSGQEFPECFHGQTAVFIKTGDNNAEEFFFHRIRELARESTSRAKNTNLPLALAGVQEWETENLKKTIALPVKQGINANFHNLIGFCFRSG
jgi:hypothetical protein